MIIGKNSGSDKLSRSCSRGYKQEAWDEKCTRCWNSILVPCNNNSNVYWLTQLSFYDPKVLVMAHWELHLLTLRKRSLVGSDLCLTSSQLSLQAGVGGACSTLQHCSRWSQVWRGKMKPPRPPPPSLWCKFKSNKCLITKDQLWIIPLKPFSSTALFQAWLKRSWCTYIWTPWTPR